MAIRTPIIEITTKSSISVNARRCYRVVLREPWVIVDLLSELGADEFVGSKVTNLRYALTIKGKSRRFSKKSRL